MDTITPTSIALLLFVVILFRFNIIVIIIFFLEGAVTNPAI